MLLADRSSAAMEADVDVWAVYLTVNRVFTHTRRRRFDYFELWLYMFELRVVVKGLRDLGTSNLKAGTPVTCDTGKDIHGTFPYGLSTGF